MWVALVSVGAALVLAGLGCSDSGDDERKEKGDLPCAGSESACRAAFEDSYEGAYTGDATGRVIFTVDSEGNAFGTATKGDGGSEGLLGEVDAHGRLELTGSDGTTFVGQLDEGHRFTGTWTASDGSSGTFAGAGTDTSSPGGSGGTSSTGGSAGSTGGRTGSGGASTGGSSSTGGSQGDVLSDPRFQPGTAEICAASAACGDDPAACLPALADLRTEAIAAGCVAQVNALFACLVDTGGCDAGEACPAQLTALFECGG